METKFDNKVVLVSGASSGIGEAIALLFAKCGAKLSLVGRNENNLRDVAARCVAERGIKPFIVTADLSTDEGCEKTAKDTMEHFGRLDILVNNAGITARTCIEQTDMKIFDEVFQIDVRGVYNLTRLLVPALIEAKGNIINISSVASSTVIVGNLPYAMAKAALDHFTRLVALELAPKGVRVNTVSPGLTVSNIVKRTTGCSEEEYQQWLKRAEKKVPMREVCVGHDIAKMVVHLASDHSRLVTGTIIQVDGGFQYCCGSDVLTVKTE